MSFLPRVTKTQLREVGALGCAPHPDPNLSSAQLPPSHRLSVLPAATALSHTDQGSWSSGQPGAFSCFFPVLAFVQ